MIRSFSLRLLAAGVFAIVAAAFLYAVSGGISAAQDSASCAPSNLNTRNWTTDFCTANVDFNEILTGNPVKNGIPALTDPGFETTGEAAEWLADRSPVIAVVIDGEARAYPQAILMWHEIANDIIADVPVAVTFCPLCNSSVTFDRRAGDAVLEFGVSGLLRNSDLIMFDWETESWWQQLTGEGLVGEYAGALLDVVPSQVISFGSFAERHPDGQVLSRATGYNRRYGINPYTGYDSNRGRPFLFRGEVDPRLPSPVDHVLAAIVNGAPVAYPFAVLREEQVINDTVGETPVVIFFQSGVATALGDSVIDTAADLGTAGMYASTIDGVTLEFTVADDGSIQDEQTGSTWNDFGEAIDGELEGSALKWINAFPHFWFAWAAFHPETEVYGLD